MLTQLFTLITIINALVVKTSILIKLTILSCSSLVAVPIMAILLMLLSLVLSRLIQPLLLTGASVLYKKINVLRVKQHSHYGTY